LRVKDEEIKNLRKRPPPEPVYVDEPSLPAGVIKRIDSAHWGAKVSFERRVFNADGSLEEEQTFW